MIREFLLLLFRLNRAVLVVAGIRLVAGGLCHILLQWLWVQALELLRVLRRTILLGIELYKIVRERWCLSDDKLRLKAHRQVLTI